MSVVAVIAPIQTSCVLNDVHSGLDRTPYASDYPSSAGQRYPLVAQHSGLYLYNAAPAPAPRS